VKELSDLGLVKIEGHSGDNRVKRIVSITEKGLMYYDLAKQQLELLSIVRK
jgi:DNA-binding MarR family transcriptional regulator